MKKFKRMPDQVVPKEWAPDDEPPRYRHPLVIVREFNELTRRLRVLKPLLLLALVECAPMPLVARWAIGLVALAVTAFVFFKARGVQNEARRIEDIEPDQVKVRPEAEQENKEPEPSGSQNEMQLQELREEQRA